VLDCVLERLEGGGPGLYSYNLCSLSKRKHYREMTQIIEQSSGSDVVVLYGAQLVRLDSETARSHRAPHLSRPLTRR
jgi:hypothetical protein